MMQKAPLLVSNCKPMERIVKNYEAGFVFQASNSLDLVEKIIEMESSPELVEKHMKNAFQAVKEDLNWEKESQKLIQLIKKQHGY
jgi:glycosyltransferase involved in cell wall biosynthesis